jgi:hypothetical protein
VKIRATASDGGAVIVRESGWLTLSGERRASSPWAYGATVSRVGQTRTVVFEQVIWEPTCTGYLIDWGDGSLPERRVMPKPEGVGCALDKVEQKTRHTYAKPGEYRIIYRETESSYNHPPRTASLTRPSPSKFHDAAILRDWDSGEGFGAGSYFSAIVDALRLHQPPPSPAPILGAGRW